MGRTAGTVSNCSYCNGSGHTRASCYVLTKAQKERVRIVIGSKDTLERKKIDKVSKIIESNKVIEEYFKPKTNTVIAANTETGTGSGSVAEIKSKIIENNNNKKRKRGEYVNYKNKSSNKEQVDKYIRDKYKKGPILGSKEGDISLDKGISDDLNKNRIEFKVDVVIYYSPNTDHYYSEQAALEIINNKNKK